MRRRRRGLLAACRSSGAGIGDEDGGFNISHTFSLRDSGGSLLMQLDTLVSQ